ncbi:EAL domain-containing protein [Sphingomonas sp.]|uniref:EAL domain-containing protein n=1 Tax=Sphingomonas sp. TaxID=28214 RepID=UPI002E2FE5E5|nr:EAL domain-containing protein [Sphingomonas sp.]HEX4694926.1 EAL domain-containing protein [Sphingomonas sp.]
MGGSRRYRNPALARSEGRAPVGLLLTRDFRRLEDEQEENAARERNRALDFAPAFLLAIHLICGGAILLDLALRGPLPALVAAPLGVVAALDLALFFWCRHRPVSSLAPHLAVQGAALYAIGAGTLWIAAAAFAPSAGDALLPGIAFAGGILAIPIAFLSFPALALLGSVICVAAIMVLTGEPGATAAASLLALCLVAFSFRRAGADAAQLRRRIEIDWSAQRASRFIEEFEQAGRGWFWETTGRGALSYVSEHLAACLQTAADELIGRPFSELIGADEGGGSERTLGFHLSARLPFTDVTVRANTAAETWWSLSGTPSFDEHGRFLGFRGIGTDLTQQRRSDEEINRLAKYDSLTGLPNRMLMRRTLDEALQNQQGSAACALFLIDLDRFKNVNDTLGHPIGDALLKQVAQRLTSVVGVKGQIGRLGGDEFEAVLPTLHDGAALASLAERLIQQISMPYSIEGHNISIGASVGIAIAPTVDTCADALIRNADLALYSAKAAGRGTFCFFAPEMHSEAQDRQILENDLRKAIGRGELQLVYQPVVNAQSEQLSGFEALVRWHHASRGVISPSIFIPLAEESGLIPQIGEWVLRTACHEAAKWPEQIRVAVNLSPLQFVDPSLPTIVMSALANSQIQPRQLELEITEGVFLVESESTDDMFAKLKSLGVRLALDDFGTGYSSLGYLKKAPFDKIKIDQSFVRGAAVPGNRNAAIIKAIVTLANTLYMETTAEGVEHQDEVELIRELGCSHIQGYVYGKAMRCEDVVLQLNAAGGQATAKGYKASRSPRSTMLRTAMLDLGIAQGEVRIRNISSTGAMIDGIEFPGDPVGVDVQLELLEGQMFPATVRWAKDGRAGVEFSEYFNLERLNAAAPNRGLRKAG